MFVAGAINLLWTALLTAFMLVEKVAPARQQIEKLAGIVFIFAGVGMVYSELV
jgi:predicted metal-binding membrane protein